jgi:DNA-directed RNA polymerase subunit omega
MVEETDNIVEESTGENRDGKTIPAIDSKYRMIILAAQRSKQLQRGATPRVDADMRKQKPTRVALKELEKQKINFDILDS